MRAGERGINLHSRSGGMARSPPPSEGESAASGLGRFLHFVRCVRVCMSVWREEEPEEGESHVRVCMRGKGRKGVECEENGTLMKKTGQ